MPAGGGLAVGGCRDARSGRFRTGSSACQPVIEALAVIRRHAAAGSLTYYPAGEHVPAHTGITEDWKPLVYRTDQHGRQRVVRMVYEVVTFRSARAPIRCTVEISRSARVSVISRCRSCTSAASRVSISGRG